MFDMDSKYAAIGGQASHIRNNNNKRKAPCDSIKVKKIKLSLGNAPKSNGLVLPPQKVQESTSSHEIKNVENLLEERKKLPVYTVRHRLLEEIKKNHTMIILGETGSGKTTQIPQLIHEQRLEGAGAIGVTQPRRVAAITIALRVAAEMNTQVGNIVGYSVRFEDVTSPRTKVKYLTDGMLLREAIIDPLLKKYSVIILDEAHERTVSTDVLFGVVKLAQKERDKQKNNPLKIIIMSATMDVDTFRKYYDNCPVIYLEGRTYPVTIYHSKMKQEDYQYAAVCTIFQLHATTPPNHDFLVFLTGQEEIETVMYNIKQIAKEAPGPPVVVCPLYAGLPATKQLQVWKNTPQGTRKIVLATNIAEASVTIPNIKCVIDSGVVKERTCRDDIRLTVGPHWARVPSGRKQLKDLDEAYVKRHTKLRDILSWCTRTGAERLRVVACAAAAAWQRAGRAGRTAPGAAYRLYTSAELAARAPHHTPEILRCPLAPTILLLIAAGIEPSTFPLIEAPPPESITASLTLLKELGAIDNEVNPKLTIIGRKMSAFPIDPKYAKVLLTAPEYNCLEEMLSLVAVLSSENIFHTPMHKREEALKVKQKFISPTGDHITLLNVFKAFCKAPLKKQWCKENYLNHKNLSYASEVRHQLLTICQSLKLQVTSCGSATDQVLKCLLSGLFTQCAWLRGGAGGGRARYATAGGAAAALHPAAALHAARPAPPALLYSDLLHTKRSYLLTASAIQPHWLQQVAPDYATRCSAYR